MKFDQVRMFKSVKAKIIILKGGEYKMAYKITEKCISCGACAAECPVGCISQGEERFEINKDMCIGCGTCAGVCPVGAPEEDND